jgi:hypothetical protein
MFLCFCGRSRAVLVEFLPGLISSCIYRILRYLGAELALAHFLPQESKSLVERYEIRKRSRTKLIDTVPLEMRNRISDVMVESSSPVKGIS